MYSMAAGARRAPSCTVYSEGPVGEIMNSIPFPKGLREYSTKGLKGRLYQTFFSISLFSLSYQIFQNIFQSLYLFALTISNYPRRLENEFAEKTNFLGLFLKVQNGRRNKTTAEQRFCVILKNAKQSSVLFWIKDVIEMELFYDLKFWSLTNLTLL